MLIPKRTRKKASIGAASCVFDYPLPTEAVGVSIQELNGRIPTKGLYRNKVCWEAAIVLKGKATVFIEGQRFNAKPGDMIIIEPKRRHYLLARKLQLVTITKPNWYESQCETIGGK